MKWIDEADPDPILLEIYRHRFSGIAEEMGVTLQRTSYSPNIKERLDFSCALFDGAGNLIAQAAHIPVHLGAMPASVAAALAAFPSWEAGDLVLLNDPYDGGTHLPDLTMVSPVFASAGDAPAFFVATRAHHADVGGMTPGSLPLSTEIFQEGIVIPPVKLYRAGVLNADLQRLLLRNVRTPEERLGDLSAQRAAHAVGARRLTELCERHGRAEVGAYARHLLAYSERLMRAALAAWPAGVYRYADSLVLDDRPGAPELTIRLAVTVGDGAVDFDFAGTSPAGPTSLNAVLSITQSACYYVVQALAGETIPVNAGCFAPVAVRAPAGCLVHALPPSAVAGGNVETSQRIVDVALGALALAMPDRAPAASQGTMNNLTIGGLRSDGSPYAYYETIGGGMGASTRHDGLDGVQVHMTNTLNTPVEALELSFPFRITQYALRSGSGGDGRHRGGDGIVREYEMLQPATVTMLSERRSVGPSGLAGGDSGLPGRNVLVDADGRETILPGKFSRRLEAGERLRIETPGGGGYGRK
ncbi:MAG: hydantoinase B/oxoprolinase family protein [Rhodothermales bacterium]